MVRLCANCYLRICHCLITTVVNYTGEMTMTTIVPLDPNMPVIEVNLPLVVEQDASQLITDSILKVTDADTQVKCLYYVLFINY